jgi:glycerol-3-phosphate dehydrogenase
VDQVLARSGFSTAPLVGGTKGSHLILARFPGAPETAVYAEAKSDGRPIFIIPWSGKFLIGTTDTRYNGGLDCVQIDDQEIDYLLAETNRLIPDAQLSRDSILFTYSGVRPLPFTDAGAEEGITRRHFIHEHSEPRGLISLIGGKLTTYRSLAEHAVDLCLRRLGSKAQSCTTAEIPLPGARGLRRQNAKRSGVLSSSVSDIHQFCGVSIQTSERLTRVYGERAVDVLELADTDERLRAIFDDETGAIAAEIVFSFRHELAQTLTDCLLRRTMVGLNPSCGLNAVVAAAEIGGEHLDWSNERKRREVAEYRKYVQRFHPRVSQ